MNIFVIDKDPVVAAQNLCDKHVVKMILESAQMLCAPFENGEAPNGYGSLRPIINGYLPMPMLYATNILPVIIKSTKVFRP